jgi:hypothetical protein
MTGASSEISIIASSLNGLHIQVSRDCQSKFKNTIYVLSLKIHFKCNDTDKQNLKG